jgi:hypothetical protein
LFLIYFRVLMHDTSERDFISLSITATQLELQPTERWALGTVNS